MVYAELPLRCPFGHPNHPFSVFLDVRKHYCVSGRLTLKWETNVAFSSGSFRENNQANTRHMIYKNRSSLMLLSPREVFHSLLRIESIDPSKKFQCCFSKGTPSTREKAP